MGGFNVKVPTGSHAESEPSWGHKAESKLKIEAGPGKKHSTVALAHARLKVARGLKAQA